MQGLSHRSQNSSTSNDVPETSESQITATRRASRCDMRNLAEASVSAVDRSLIGELFRGGVCWLEEVGGRDRIDNALRRSPILGQGQLFKHQGRTHRRHKPTALSIIWKTDGHCAEPRLDLLRSVIVSSWTR